jgi:hypothetical protein
MLQPRWVALDFTILRITVTEICGLSRVYNLGLYRLHDVHEHGRSRAISTSHDSCNTLSSLLPNQKRLRMSATATMTATTLEPFPLFIDSAPADAANYFSNISSKMSSLHMLSSPPARISRPRIDKLSKELQLRYYQYEVTFGLYMLNTREKLVLNSIVLVLLSAIIYAFCWGVQPYLINMICKAVYYITGSFTVAGEMCVVDAGTACTR